VEGEKVHRYIILLQHWCSPVTVGRIRERLFYPRMWAVTGCLRRI